MYLNYIQDQSSANPENKESIPTKPRTSIGIIRDHILKLLNWLRPNIMHPIYENS